MIRVFVAVFALMLIVLLAAVVLRESSGDSLERQQRDWYPCEDRFHMKVFPDCLGPPFPNKLPHTVTEGKIQRDEEKTTEEGTAKFLDGTHTEERTDVRVKVADENDNALVFGEIESGKVDELSPTGTFVMKVTATYADKPQNHTSEIAYTIIKQHPPDDLFYINRKNGSIYVKKPHLDREKCDRYILTIKGEDLNGPPERNTATSNVTVNVGDVNDNYPTLEKHRYEGSIEENTQGVEVLKIKAEDLDLKGTDNWEAVFAILSGNEAGYFSIRKYPNTNKAILMLDKPVDYEDVKNFELRLAVGNKNLPFYRSVRKNWSNLEENVPELPMGATGAAGAAGVFFNFKDILIKISVKNQREGPRFVPRVKVITISEEGTSFNITEVIARYSAIDEDTRELAENVSYAKNSDRDNWLTIDPETAEIKLNKIPDRESPHLVNGIYIAIILCITEDRPTKTATGTIAIQVEDFNDHYPILTSDNHTICTTENAVIVNADDKDSYPKGPLFSFEIIPEGTEGKWRIEHLTNTSVILRAQEYLWPDVYEVKLMVKDQMGYVCPEPQEVLVQVCTCEDKVVCGVHIGPAVIRILARGPVLVLLLVPLLMISCRCRRAAGNLSTTNAGTFTNLLSVVSEPIPPAATAETLSFRDGTQGEVKKMMLA